MTELPAESTAQAVYNAAALENFSKLLERTSLGTAAARRLRSRVSADAARRIVLLSSLEELESTGARLGETVDLLPKLDAGEAPQSDSEEDLHEQVRPLAEDDRAQHRIPSRSGYTLEHPPPDEPPNGVRTPSLWRIQARWWKRHTPTLDQQNAESPVCEHCGQSWPCFSWISWDDQIYLQARARHLSPLDSEVPAPADPITDELRRRAAFRAGVDRLQVQAPDEDDRAQHQTPSRSGYTLEHPPREAPSGVSPRLWSVAAKAWHAHTPDQLHDKHCASCEQIWPCKSWTAVDNFLAKLATEAGPIQPMDPPNLDLTVYRADGATEFKNQYIGGPRAIPGTAPAARHGAAY